MTSVIFISLQDDDLFSRYSVFSGSFWRINLSVLRGFISIRYVHGLFLHGGQLFVKVKSPAVTVKRDQLKNFIHIRKF